MDQNQVTQKKHFWSFFGTDVSYFFIWQIVQGFLERSKETRSFKDVMNCSFLLPEGLL
jgi:hypothetical protein